MPIYIHIPVAYERQLQELADESMRTSRQQAAWLLCVTIERAVKERDMARERDLDAFLQDDPAPVSGGNHD